MKLNSIASLWRFPIKSFGGEKLEKAHLTMNGILGDRAFALIDEETGKVVNAKNYKQFPEVLMCHAAFVEPPQMGKKLPPVMITLSDGIVVKSDSENVNRILSDFLGRVVSIIPVKEDDKSIHKNSISLITTSTLNKLRELSPGSDSDERRFRMNLLVETHDPGFVEDSWVGKEVSIGDKIRLKITKPDPRCVIITLPQEGLPMDNQILKTIFEHNIIYVAGKGDRPCAGVYADIRDNGMIKSNDTVAVIN